MKALNVLFVALIMAAMISTPAEAQTKQKVLVASFGEMYIACLDRTIDGTWTAHFTYHLGKDGKISRIHINTKKSDFWDVHTGEKVKVFDTFTDSYGTYFWFLNNPNEANGGTDIYNVEDGWLDEYMPDNVLPFEPVYEVGTTVEMNWKFQIKGEKFGVSWLIQVHENALGEVKANVEKVKSLCSE